MNPQDFLKNFSDQFDETDASSFSMETKFRDLDEWSSMVGLSVIAMVDEKYDVQIGGNDMKAANTIQDLYNLVDGRLAKK